jgi:putative ABC transport system permease protein
MSKNISFFDKLKGALFFSSKSYSKGLKSGKQYQGILIFIFGSFLFSLIFATSTWDPFMDLFYHYNLLIDLGYISINIFFSPILFTLVEVILLIGWLFIIFIISRYKEINFICLLNSGFVFSPFVFSIFYFLNKYLLKISIVSFGEILLALMGIWTFITGLIYLFTIIEIRVGGIFKLSVKSILNRKKRSIGTILGISVSVALIVIPIPLINGYYTQIGVLAGKYQYASYLIISNSSTNLYTNSYIDIELNNQINHPNIDIKCPQKLYTINLSYNNRNLTTHIRGMNYSIFKLTRIIYCSSVGNPENLNDSQIIMGMELANLFNISFENLPVAINITQNNLIKEVVIIGIFQTSSFYDADVITNFNLSNELNPVISNYYSIIELKLKDYTQSDTVITYISQNFQQLKAQRENQMDSFIDDLINRTSNSLILLSILIFILMIFGMYHSTRVIVKESKNEILIFNSIGANKSQIIRKFLYESLILSLLGGLLGTFGGIFLCYGVSYIIFLAISIYVAPIFDPISILFSLLISVISGLLGGIIPSYSLTKNIIRRGK